MSGPRHGPNRPPVLREFEAEMRYLREAAKEFAQSHPQAAARLGLTRFGGRGDAVEQLFQGFAFLSARMGGKLADELPELTEPLTGMLWPHTVRTIPSLTILELLPHAERPAGQVLPAGLTVRSTPVGDAQTVCTYRTTQFVNVLPLTLRDAAQQLRPDGRSAIRLAFEVRRFDRRSPGVLSRIRLYLHGDRIVASTLYAALTRDAYAIEVRMPSFHDGRAQPQPKMTLQAAGFGPATRLWPQDERKPGESLDAEQGMLEYFTFAEKFHFIDLCGFDAACLPAGETQVAFEIVLTRPLASEVTLDTSNVRLHCTPVINLFEVDAVPIQTVRHEREYRVMSPPSAGPHIEPYAAVSVVALDHRTADKHAYAPFAAFRHRGGMLRHEAPERYYHTRCVRGPSGARELWLTLDGQAWDAPGSLPDDHVTVRVMACNGRLPRMALHESSLTASSAPLPGIEAVRNLLPPTMPLYPPEGEGYQWKVLSHFAPNQLSLLDADVLRETLALYDWTGGEANRRRIEAITDVRHRLLHKLERGGLRRGVEIEVTLDPSGFMGSGDIALFGDVLNRFIGRYASVQHFVQLVLCVAPSDFDRASAARIEFARIEYDGPGL